MESRARPRRSVLYMPGANARALDKARTLPVDGLIFDLEDAVAPDEKQKAREQVQRALAEGGYGRRELFVRVNALDTPWGIEDARMAAHSGADAVLLPKVESAESVRALESLLSAERAPDALAIWCMMETPLGMLRAEEIAKSSRRLAGFVMGTSDLAKELRCAHTPLRLPLLTSLGLCLLAARAYGLAILDGVYLALNDDAGYAAACSQGRELGFDGKTLIHPKQIEQANALFSPTAEELELARKIIAAHAEARARGQGVVVVEGRLIESLHVVAAERQVELAEAIEQRREAPGSAP